MGMKKPTSIFFFALLFVLGVTLSVSAQRNVTPQVDPVLEADALHNLDVARQAFRLKKAYKGVLMRFEETFAAYPAFSRMDEFLYLAGMSSYYLSKNEGKQKVNLKIEREREKYSPERLREDAIAYLSIMLERNPESSFKEDAERVLKELRGGQ